MRRILVLRGGALGDFIVTLPALALLRQRWPDARIELAGNATAAEVARARGMIDAAHSQHEARWGALYGAAPLPAEFGAWLARFDLVVNYWPDPDGELHRRFPARDGQVFLSAAAMPTIAPAAAHYASALKPLGLETRDFFCLIESDAIALHPRAIDVRAIRRAVAADAPIAIHPGSGSPRKNWPLERWAALATWLRDEFAARLLIITGEAEDQAALASLAAVAERAHALPLKELAARLRGCRLFLGHDSGVSHLAAACGVPSVLLFGPTDPAMWAPPATHVTVLRRGMALEAIAIRDVQSAIGAMRDR
jgi:heptosyltransferase III